MWILGCKHLRLSFIYVKGDLSALLANAVIILFPGQLLSVSNHKKLWIDFGATF